MNVADAVLLARSLLKLHGLWEAGWRIGLSKSRSSCGDCTYSHKLIRLSEPTILINEASVVENTIRHEIAHALTEGDGHGRRWRAKFYELGGKATIVNDAVVTAFKYSGTCPACRVKTFRNSIPRRRCACEPCCVKSSDGRFDERFALVWRRA